MDWKLVSYRNVLLTALEGKKARSSCMQIECLEKKKKKPTLCRLPGASCCVLTGQKQIALQPHQQGYYDPFKNIIIVVKFQHVNFLRDSYIETVACWERQFLVLIGSLILFSQKAEIHVTLSQMITFCQVQAAETKCGPIHLSGIHVCTFK